MTGYIDSSVVLRILLNEPKKISNLQDFDELVASELIRVECFRVLHRYRLTGQIDDKNLSEKVMLLESLFDEIGMVSLSRLILNRASLSTPTVLGTLDAIHLVTAQLWQETKNQEIVMLTHDVQLQAAARSVGIRVH